MKHSVVLSFTLSALVLAGCGGKSDSDSITAPPPPQNATQVGIQTAPANGITPPPPNANESSPNTSAVAPPPGADNNAAASSGPGLLEGAPKDAVPDLINLNNAFQAFRSIEMRNPKSLNELLSSGQIKSIPQPPSGMRYFIDERNLRIILVRE